MLVIIRRMANWYMSLVYEVFRNLWGTVEHPYLTWKRVIREGNVWASGLLLVLLMAYFGVSEPIRWGSIRWDGLAIERVTVESVQLLARISGLRMMAGLTTYLLMVVMMSFIGWLLIGRRTSWKSLVSKVYKVWVYSYLPTWLWFAMTAGLFVILPPPRGNTILGLMFSVVYLSVSAALLVWKVLLFYLTMRLGVGLTAWQVFKAGIILVAFLVVYSQVMYLWGIFRIPFI